jgi:SAM-dependent methyltransferase
MNEGHAARCSSQEWAEFITTEVVPSVLGDKVATGPLLEIGPGYGAATAMLTTIVGDLTAVEIDPELAARLRERFPAVHVVDGSGDDLPFADGTFAAVFCFTMLHHVHSVGAQDGLFAEARRVLRPGGTFGGSDSIANPRLRDFHHDDIYVPVDPDALPDRLRAAGFADVDVRVVGADHWFWFTAVTGTGGTP